MSFEGEYLHPLPLPAHFTFTKYTYTPTPTPISLVSIIDSDCIKTQQMRDLLEETKRPYH